MTKIRVFRIPRVGRPKWIRAECESSGTVKIKDSTFIARTEDQFNYRNGSAVVWVEGSPTSSPIRSNDPKTISVINPETLDETLNGGFIREFLQRKLQSGLSKAVPWITLVVLGILLLVSFYSAKEASAAHSTAKHILEIVQASPTPSQSVTYYN